MDDYPTFTGRDALLAMIDEALALGDHEAVTSSLRDGLCRLIRDKSVFLPECVFEPVEGHYARRELYACSKTGISVVAMTWAPGQGTPIHDHCGLWCVEGVWQGHLEIVRYELEETNGDLNRFSMHETLMAGTGTAGSLLPPHEYHTIRNPNEKQIAISLHIYQAAMNDCATFEPQGDNWYLRKKKALCLDTVECR
ncbi:MAG TPA: cysteine dioxygenase family protein [Arenimonas sp.]|jgi:predicted metal-dependent enzyme (double-stranded beta helix superfamily)|nr:cysteine dioxygenase family protein [Arenimonas sp.]HOZ05330.1 cysteine dioxygenase family protein [Arenimonas sp.]HPO24450.1 cysteine dioxygenase family protein [Arenimonas sp.]HPW32902.1 cysteine dioxygenase family protein [Arenimonas sp.]